jgi:hypothetical protein
LLTVAVPAAEQVAAVVLMVGTGGVMHCVAETVLMPGLTQPIGKVLLVAVKVTV